MHYYQFNIADYRKDTVHLTPMEHYIYRQLIDWYYLDETPIPRETQAVLRRIGLGSPGLSELENVLQDFFKSTAKGWVHGRIEEELDGYRQKAGIARQNGRKGGRPRNQPLSGDNKPTITQPVIHRNPEITGSKANQEPVTINQEPIDIKPIVATPKNKSRKKYKFDDADMELSTFIWLHVSGLATGQKEPNFEAWANHVRLMREIDGRSHEDIKAVFLWAHNDYTFWRTNIRSPDKLRTQYDQLNIKRMNGHKHKPENLFEKDYTTGANTDALDRL